jgi:hypothetical protein
MMDLLTKGFQYAAGTAYGALEQRVLALCFLHALMATPLIEPTLQTLLVGTLGA